jgi:hypothetical protein
MLSIADSVVAYRRNEYGLEIQDSFKRKAETEKKRANSQAGTRK